MLTTLARGAAELGLSLTPRQLGLFELYYLLLSSGGRRAGVTAVTGYEQVQQRHFLESLALAAALLEEGLLDGSSTLSVLDLGAGGGFPGLPIKVLLPNLSLTLLEASRRKSDFLREVIESLELEGVEVITSRAEGLGRQEGYRERFDLVVARAVAPLAVLLELALPLLRVGGSLATPKGGRAQAEVEAAGPALSILGGAVLWEKPLKAPDAVHPQTLVVVRKEAATPDRYPRKAGMPKKRPLS
jgi:16S rRNA (guanine527-N7)-methyltransferase